MDMQLVAVMAGDGSNSVLKVNNDDGADVGSNLARLFRDNPAFANLRDITFDLDAGYFFVVDSDFSDSNGILRGNIADLYSGTATPTLTRVFETDFFGEGIPSIEIDAVNQKLYWLDGSFDAGWELRRSNYDGSNVEVIAVLDDENFEPFIGFPGGVADFVIDVARDTAYIVHSTALIDGFGDAFVLQNHIIQVNSLTPDADSDDFTILGVGDGDGSDGFMPGRLDPSFGQIAGLDVDRDTGEIYFVTQPISSNDTAGIFHYDPVADVLTQLWLQPSPGTHDSLQTFPTGIMTNIEYDEVADVYYVTTKSHPDDEFDGTPAVNEADSSIFIGDPAGGAPTRFARVHEAGDGGSPLGMEIDYAAELVATASGISFVEQGLAVDVASGLGISDPDQSTVKGATVSISAGFLAGDTLSFTALPGISGSYNGATGVLTLSGSASFADYQTVLDSITFSASGDNPTGYGDSPSRTISFSLFDGLINGDPVDVTVNVQAVNDAPVNTVGGPINTIEGAPPVAVTGLSVSDVDADPANDTISVTLSATLGSINVSTSEPGGLAAGQVSDNGTGSVTLSGTQNQINATLAAANGVTYTPGNGGIDALVMTSNDLGHTGPGAQQDVDAVVITVISLNDPPTAPANNSAITAEDTASAATTIGASDPDGDSLTYLEKPGAEAAHGTVTFDQVNGTFTYTPDANYNGPDGFTILISDGNGGTAEQVVSMTVTAVNDAPTAPAANSATAAEDSASAATPIGANDVDGDTLTYSVKGGFGPANGSVAFNQAAGTFTYTPAPNFNGSDSFTILIDDGHGGTAEQVVSVTVTPVNDAPTAPATGSVTTAEDTASAANAIGASDIDGDTLSYSEKAGAEAANGTVTFDQANGTYTYTPDSNFHGADSFTILISDGHGGTTEQVVSVNVTPVNDAPTAPATGTVTTAEDAASAATSIGASDVDGDTLSYSVTAAAAHGSVSLDQVNGTYTYTPDANYNGPDGFTILISDGHGGTTEQVVSVTVTPVNDAPTAPATGSVTTAEDTASAATAIGASDIDGDSLSYSEKAGAGAVNGTVTFDQANGTYIYTPDPDYNGSDSFTILIEDGHGGTAEQVVSVNVTPVNDAPTGVDGTLAAPEDAVNGSAAGTLAAEDPDSSSFTYVLLDDAGGRFAMDANGNVTVADGLLLDYEQASSHTIRVGVTDDMGAYSEFDHEVSVIDVLGEDVTGDARDNIFWGGAEDDVLRGMDGNDTLVGGGGQDTLLGGNGADTIEGGAGDDNLQGGAGDDVLSGGLGVDNMVGGDGKDVYVLRKGEANGDTITGFFGMGAADGDSIVLEGFGAGTTFQRIGGGSSTLYEINDNGHFEYVTIVATGQVHSTDYTFDPIAPVVSFNEYSM